MIDVVITRVAISLVNQTAFFLIYSDGCIRKKAVWFTRLGCHVVYSKASIYNIILYVVKLGHECDGV